MNVTENYMLQQIQQMAANMATTLPQTGSGDKDQSFQDMMAQAGQDSGTTEVSETKQPASTATAQKKPQPQGQSKEKDAAKSQEQNGDPNAMQYAVDPFRPEIVEVAQEEVTAEEPVVMDVSVGSVPVKFVEVTPAKRLSLISEDRKVEADPILVEQRPRADELPVIRPVMMPQKAVQEPVQEMIPEEQSVQEEVQQMLEPQEIVPEGKMETVEVEVEVKEVSQTSNEEMEESGSTQDEAAELQQQPLFHDVEAAPVKVAERYESVDTQAPDMEEKLAANIHRAVDDGAQRVQITLNPANLGQVTVEMTRDASGVLQVALHVVSGKAEQLLGQHLDGLHAALAAYGQGQEVKVEVQRNQEAPQQQNQQDQHQANPDGHNQQQQQHRDRQERHTENSGDFLQKLRLGLFVGDILQ